MFPDSRDGASADRERAPERASITRVLLLGEVLLHREALARALDAYDDIALIGSVADVHAALILAAEGMPDVMIVDSPSDAVRRRGRKGRVEAEVIHLGEVGGLLRLAKLLRTPFSKTPFSNCRRIRHSHTGVEAMFTLHTVYSLLPRRHEASRPAGGR